MTGQESAASGEGLEAAALRWRRAVARWIGKMPRASSRPRWVWEDGPTLRRRERVRPSFQKETGDMLRECETFAQAIDTRDQSDILSYAVRAAVEELIGALRRSPDRPTSEQHDRVCGVRDALSRHRAHAIEQSQEDAERRQLAQAVAEELQNGQTALASKIEDLAAQDRNPDRLIDRTEAARVLGVGRTTFGELRRDGVVPEPWTTIGKRPRWRFSDIEKVARRRRR